MGGQRTMTHTAGGEGRSGGATPAAPDEYPPHMNVGKAENPMNIAVICPRFPLPMTRADQKTVAHLLAFLSARGHSVDLYSLYEGAPPSAEQREWIGDRCRDVTVFDQPGWRTRDLAYTRASLYSPKWSWHLASESVTSLLTSALVDGRISKM